jgi:hypothetical protein
MNLYLHAKSLESRIPLFADGMAARVPRGRNEPCDEFGTGLRRRLEAGGVPLIAALSGRAAFRTEPSRG